MGTINRKIEVDDATAAALESRAAEQGLSVPELVAELAQGASEPVAMSDQTIAELDRLWEATEAGEFINNADVVRWLQTWGSPQYKPWRKR